MYTHLKFFKFYFVYIFPLNYLILFVNIQNVSLSHSNRCGKFEAMVLKLVCLILFYMEQQ